VFLCQSSAIIKQFNSIVFKVVSIP